MDLGSEFSDTGNFSGFNNNDLYGGDKSSNTFERNFHNIFEEAKKYRQRIYDAERKMNGGADDKNSSKPKRQINKPLRLMLDISKILRDSGNYKDFKIGDYMGIAKLISDHAKEKVGTTEISDEVRSEALKMARDPDEFVTKYKSKKQSSSSSSSGSGNSRRNSRNNSRNRSRRNNDWDDNSDDSDDSDDSNDWDQRGGNNDGDNIKTDVWNNPQQTSNLTGGCGCGMKGGNNWDNMRVFNDTKNLSNNNSTNTLNNNNTIISNLNNATNTLNNNNTTTSNLNNSTIVSNLNNATNTSNLNNAVSTLDNNNANISNFNNATNTRNTYAFNNGNNSNKLNNTTWSNFRKSTIY
ncbi:hypothetical protein QJ850_gp568 [Acanthamoeba polyphaga mimivirus]|uniref:Uncharacterized protein n=1 Tax=Acanthamoeba polyphaga mimivirus Kroon TaxID=3069720 RepID=A0A0G2YAL6_9VIRU|nr:hypothetical protein QJ850_gp568 [Acanthamoeba polyphaga mimivirus]AKI80131.1 hypothetical protein [Acanthamoeba polyphaga mimivirus Kroon]